MDAKDKEIAEKEERQAKRQAELERLEKEQYSKDLDEKEKLVEAHGTIVAVKMTRFRPGFPSRIYLRAPDAGEYKRYNDMIHRAIGGEKKNPVAVKAAGELLARAVWVYPLKEDERDAMLDVFPGLLGTIAIAATKLAEGKEADEGKD